MPNFPPQPDQVAVTLSEMSLPTQQLVLHTMGKLGRDHAAPMDVEQAEDYIGDVVVEGRYSQLVHVMEGIGYQLQMVMEAVRHQDTE